MTKLLMQEEILSQALIHSKKAFVKFLAKRGMDEYFDLDVTGYCYDNKGNMTFKIAMEAQDGIEDYYEGDDDGGIEIDGE